MSTPNLKHIFTYHEPKNQEQLDRYKWIRDTAREFGEAIVRLCPDSRERSLAITKLEETVMWANAAIARESDSFHLQRVGEDCEEE